MAIIGTVLPRVSTVRTIVACAAASAFAVPLLLTLHARVPATRQRPLVEPTPSDRLVPFEIGRSTRLVVADAAALTSHQRILLMVATYGTVPRLLDGHLSFAGTTCVYRAATDIDLADNYLLAFERDPGCAPASGQAMGEATLVFRRSNAARIALVTYVGDPPPRDALVLATPGMAEAHLSPILQGD